MVLDMPDIVKPFKVLNTREEPDGGQGVDFEVTKAEYVDELHTKTIKMTSYVSIPAGENIDNYLFTYLSEGGWL
jgi:hypothetical protein